MIVIIPIGIAIEIRPLRMATALLAAISTVVVGALAPALDLLTMIDTTVLLVMVDGSAMVAMTRDLRIPIPTDAIGTRDESEAAAQEEAVANQQRRS